MCLYGIEFQSILNWRVLLEASVLGLKGVNGGNINGIPLLSKFQFRMVMCG